MTQPPQRAAGLEKALPSQPSLSLPQQCGGAAPRRGLPVGPPHAPHGRAPPAPPRCSAPCSQEASWKPASAALGLAVAVVDFLWVLNSRAHVLVQTRGHRGGSSRSWLGLSAHSGRCHHLLPRCKHEIPVLV